MVPKSQSMIGPAAFGPVERKYIMAEGAAYLMLARKQRHRSQGHNIPFKDKAPVTSILSTRPNFLQV